MQNSYLQTLSLVGLGVRMTPSSYLTVQCTLTLRRASIQMDGSWATVATPVSRGYWSQSSTHRPGQKERNNKSHISKQETWSKGGSVFGKWGFAACTNPPGTFHFPLEGVRTSSSQRPVSTTSAMTTGMMIVMTIHATTKSGARTTRGALLENAL